MTVVTDTKTLSRLQSREKFLERQRVNDIRAVMSTPEGRRFTWRLIYGECGLKTVTVQAGPDKEYLLRNEGRREIGARLDAALEEICPREHGLMATEASVERHENEIHRKAAEEAQQEDF